MTTETKVDQIILDRMVQGPEGKRIRADIEGKALAERRRLAAEIATLDAELAKAVPALEAKVERAKASVVTAEEALHLAREGHATASNERRSVMLGSDQRRSECEARLRESAPEEVAAFIRELETLTNEVRTQRITTQPGARHWLTGKAAAPTSNFPAISRTLDAIREARSQAERLKAEPLEAGEVTAKIDALKQAIEKAGEER